jgi:hypothetical protein
MIGTLTSSILKSVHTIVSPIIFYNLYYMATPDYPKCLRLQNHVGIVTFKPDLQRVSFGSIIDPPYYSPITRLLLPLIPRKGFIRALEPFIICGRSLSALWLLWRADLCKIVRRVGTSAERGDDFG